MIYAANFASAVPIHAPTNVFNLNFRQPHCPTRPWFSVKFAPVLTLLLGWAVSVSPRGNGERASPPPLPCWACRPYRRRRCRPWCRRRRRCRCRGTRASRRRWSGEAASWGYFRMGDGIDWHTLSLVFAFGNLLIDGCLCELSLPPPLSFSLSQAKAKANFCLFVSLLFFSHFTHFGWLTLGCCCCCCSGGVGQSRACLLLP